MFSLSSIQGRLIFSVGAGVILFAIISGIAISLLNGVITEYHRIISGPVAQERRINELNVKFRLQVREWKNVLLRGKDPAKLNEYWGQFETLHQEIQREGGELDKSLEGESRAKLAAFLRAHQQALTRHQDGLRSFRDSGFDPAAGDQAVVGIDRELSKLLAESAALISQEVARTIEQEQAVSNRVSLWTGALIILGAITVVVLVLTILRKSLLVPLAQINAHLTKLAEGNFRQPLAFSAAGELGQLGLNIQQVQRAMVEMIGAIQRSTSSLSQAASAITQSSQSLATYADDTHRATDQVSSAITEMGATVHDVAGNASGAADAAQSAEDNARNGLQVMESTLNAIHQLSQNAIQVSAAMTQLENDTGRIGSVLDVIRNVAEQTNLLALNAAIEAARAGEQGRGFAVVADEVRSLAKRTQDSTAEIQQIIQAVQQGAANAMQAMKSSEEKTSVTLEMAGQAGHSINQITKSISNILGMNMQIATAAEEQSYAAEEINKSILGLAELISSLNKDAQQSAQIAKQLDGTAKQLETQITRFAI